MSTTGWYWIMSLLVALVAFLISAAYVYTRKLHDYFQNLGVPYERATFPWGSMWPALALKQSYSHMLVGLYNKHKGKKIVGFYQFFRKSVLIMDVDLLKHVLVKDFEYFDGKGIHYNRELEPLSATLFALEGSEWKQLRVKLTATFSSGKLKNMFGTVVDVAKKLGEYIDTLVADNDVLECKDLAGRYGLANIASTAFGLESDVLTDKSSLFFRMALTIVEPTLGTTVRNGLLIYGGDIATKFQLRTIRKDAHEFFLKLIQDTVQYRETQGKTRNDFLQLLIDLKKGVKVDGEEFSITLEEVAAQAYVFVIGGFEPTSNVISFCLYELAIHPEIQRRVQEEIDQAEEITYDTLTAMEYLEMVMDETMRKHTPLGFISRVCTRDYAVPDSDYVIEKGTHIVVSTQGLHLDPDLFPEPEKFIPERFSKENKSSIKSFSYMPFGEGQRFCIAMRYGKMAVKAGLAVLLRQFEVRKTPNTPLIPQYEPRTINTSMKGGLWLQFVPRNKQASSV